MRPLGPFWQGFSDGCGKGALILLLPYLVLIAILVFW